MRVPCATPAPTTVCPTAIVPDATALTVSVVVEIDPVNDAPLSAFVGFSVVYASSTPGTSKTAPCTEGSDPCAFSATDCCRRYSNSARVSTFWPITPDEQVTESQPGMAW
jgi:hypothetical protein